ncbi:MAG: hypothetical protein ACKERG_04720 [Candidatus Hodgkinia cicadicola]
MCLMVHSVCQWRTTLSMRWPQVYWLSAVRSDEMRAAKAGGRLQWAEGRRLPLI